MRPHNEIQRLIKRRGTRWAPTVKIHLNRRPTSSRTEIYFSGMLFSKPWARKRKFTHTGGHQVRKQKSTFSARLKTNNLTCRELLFFCTLPGRRRERRKELTCSARFLTNDLKRRNALFLHFFHGRRWGHRKELNFFLPTLWRNLKCRN